MDNKNKGPLVKVLLQPGRFVKMHRQDAIDRGLLGEPEQKRQKASREPVENKIFVPDGNKAEQKVEPEEPLEQDDFTEIPGVGLATVQLLHHQGIYTFEQLRKADLSELYYRARQAIEEWQEE